MKRTTKVSLGLLATWAVSDLEELVTMPRTSKKVLNRLPAAVPVPPALRRDGISPRHFRRGVGLMGLLIGTATVLGVRSEGRSPLFRGVLLGFGLHGFGHLGSSVVMRGYVSGVATAPTMVIPYWLWARRELAEEGIRDADRATVLIALSGIPITLGIHALLYTLLGEQRDGPPGEQRDGGPDGPGDRARTGGMTEG